MRYQAALLAEILLFEFLVQFFKVVVRGGGRNSKVLSKIAHFVDGKYFTSGEIFNTTSFMQDYVQPNIRALYLKVLLPG
ncbi:hypothetical protein BZL68_06920 [Escherichia coli]|nr:hypothetical protein BZL68_06920 [Escherichia coli]